jgi:protein SDA1
MDDTEDVSDMNDDTDEDDDEELDSENECSDRDEEDMTKDSSSKAQKRKLSDYVGQLDSANASLGALTLQEW